MDLARRETRDARRDYAGRRMLIVGLGLSGASALRYLSREGAMLSVTDSRQAPADIETLRANFPEAQFFLGGFDAPRPLSQYLEAVISPGVALDEPFVRELAAAGVPLIGDIELFARAVNASPVSRLASAVVGITGSNGKSTVTSLLGDMARAANRRVQVGGNLGTPALDLLRDDAELYVLELSSFQLETTQSLRCDAAAVLNLSEDHLDRHGSMEAYGRAKSRVFENCGIALVNRDDAQTLRNADRSSTQLSFGLDAPKNPGEYGLVEGARLAVLEQDGRIERLIGASELRIFGLHNVANALAALALADAVGLPRESSLRALRGFTGLAHRCQLAGTLSGVRYINDSKGTNVGSTLAAIAGLPGPLIWLGGGVGKNQDFVPLAMPLARKGRAAVLFGQDAASIEQAIFGALPVYREPDMDAALSRARGLAQAGDSVLLSPGCASLDQFRNYVERGERFTAWVGARQ